MPDHPLCPPHDLPPTPCEEFFYCPDPSKLTPGQWDALFPREQREQFIRDVLRHTPTAPPTQPTASAERVLEKAHLNVS